MKKRLILLLLHCSEGAHQAYGVKLAVKSLKGMSKESKSGRKTATESTRADYLRQIYQPGMNSYKNNSIHIHTGVSLNTKLNKPSKKGTRTSIDEYKHNTNKQIRASSLEPKKLNKGLDFNYRSYTNQEATKIYQHQPYLYKLASNKFKRNNARSLSSTDKHRLDQSLTKELPPLHYQNPSISEVISTVDLDRSANSSKNASIDIHRIYPKMLQTIENEHSELHTPNPLKDHQSVLTSLSQKSSLSHTGTNDDQSDLSTCAQKKINKMRFEINSRRSAQIRSKSQDLQVLEKSDLLQKTEPNIINREMAKKLLQIKKAFDSFKAKYAKIGKVKNNEKSRQETPISEPNSSASSSVYNTITIFTHNAISNNIKIVKDEGKEEIKVETAEEILKRDLEFYKQKSLKLEDELRLVKERLKKYEQV